jgi:hypothetical protein
MTRVLFVTNGLASFFAITPIGAEQLSSATDVPLSARIHTAGLGLTILAPLTKDRDRKLYTPLHRETSLYERLRGKRYAQKNDCDPPDAGKAFCGHGPGGDCYYCDRGSNYWCSTKNLCFESLNDCQDGCPGAQFCFRCSA